MEPEGSLSCSQEPGAGPKYKACVALRNAPTFYSEDLLQNP
jgi:hypothetical protein